MTHNERWITKYCAFLVQYCDRTLKDALEEAKKIWNEAQFKFFIGDKCTTDDNFDVTVVDMVYEDGVAYYICTPDGLGTNVERSFTEEQLTTRNIENTYDMEFKKFWCVDVRRFDDKRTKTIVYPVTARYLPDDTKIKNPMCEQFHFYTITYEEAMELKRSYDKVDILIAEYNEKRRKKC
jgi:hypothetical protein